MKRLLGMLVAGSLASTLALTGCDSSQANREKDRVDDAAKTQKKEVERRAEEKKEAIDRAADAKKEAIENKDDADRRATEGTPAPGPMIVP